MTMQSSNNPPVTPPNAIPPLANPKSDYEYATEEYYEEELEKS